VIPLASWPISSTSILIKHKVTSAHLNGNKNIDDDNDPSGLLIFSCFFWPIDFAGVLASVRCYEVMTFLLSLLHIQVCIFRCSCSHYIADAAL